MFSSRDLGYAWERCPHWELLPSVFASPTFRCVSLRPPSSRFPVGTPKFSLPLPHRILILFVISSRFRWTVTLHLGFQDDIWPLTNPFATTQHHLVTTPKTQLSSIHIRKRRHRLYSPYSTDLVSFKFCYPFYSNKLFRPIALFILANLVSRGYPALSIVRWL